MTKELTNTESENLPSQGGSFSLEDMKSIFYMMNAKPDSSIQLLEGRKKICFDDIKDLNQRIQRKLENHDLIGQISTINLGFEKGKIQDYGTWAEFEREGWNSINQQTDSISLTWDISLKLPHYTNPQRHTLKVRVGNALSPKDMIELVFTSDDVSELKEKRAEGVVKVDFIDQVIAGELIERVVNWYDGLSKLSHDYSLQKLLKRYQSIGAGIIHNFTPIVFLSIYHYYFLTFCDWSSISSGITLANIQLLLILFIGVYFIGSMFGRRFSNWYGSKIDKYKGMNQFDITRGDKNAHKEAILENRKITKEISLKILYAILTATISFGVKGLLEKLIQ